MLGAFANAFRTPDLRKKLLFVLLVIAVFRPGSQVPTPGVHVANVQECFNQTKDSGIYGLINLFSGGALLQLTVYALGIMPYITASIILQLLVVVIPRLEALKKEGQSGQTKITQYTRYVTLGLAILQATGIVALARSGNLLQGCDLPLLYKDNTATAALMVVTMTAGTAVIMWLGELITDRGIGNGMSILIFTQVVATFPLALFASWTIALSDAATIGAKSIATRPAMPKCWRCARRSMSWATGGWKASPSMSPSNPVRCAPVPSGWRDRRGWFLGRGISGQGPAARFSIWCATRV